MVSSISIVGQVTDYVAMLKRISLELKIGKFGYVSDDTV